MNNNEQEWSLQAAEYVLGSLDEHDTRVFDQLYQVDSDWREQVHHWRTLLDPLNDSTPSVEAPGRILKAALVRINSGESANDPANYDASAAARTPTEENKLPAWEAPLPKSVRDTLSIYKERVRYWQLAFTTAAVAAIAVLFLTPRYFEERSVPSDETRTVAILQSDSNDLLWAISFIPGSGDSEGVVSITVVGEPEIQSDENHQLWMVLPESEEGVRSVGLMPDTPGQTIVLTLPESLDDAREFAVSLEATGGVEGPEHGPLVARTFIIEPPSD